MDLSKLIHGFLSVVILIITITSRAKGVRSSRKYHKGNSPQNSLIYLVRTLLGKEAGWNYYQVLFTIGRRGVGIIIKLIPSQSNYS